MQALRTQFVETADGPRQLVLPASAIQVETATVTKNGKALLQQHAAGGMAVTPGTSLAAAWQEAVVQPFNLYKDTLTRVKVCNAQHTFSEPSVFCCAVALCC
jgi:phage tail sheath protein FI